jgi:hypothetical protein
MLIVEEDDVLLAEGELSIIGLALPAVDIVSATPEIIITVSLTAPVLTDKPTDVPGFVSPTPIPATAKIRPPTTIPTQTKPAYPNP